MLIGETLFDVLKWSGIIAAGVCGVAVRVAPGGPKQWRWVLLCLVGVAASFAIAFVPRSYGTEIVVVKIIGEEPSKTTRSVLYGHSNYTLQDGHVVELAPNAGTLVVNDSHHAMSIEVVHYGKSFSFFKEEPVAVPSMSTTIAADGVDYIGPNDPPPNEVSSSIDFDSKYWLNW